MNDVLESSQAGRIDVPVLVDANKELEPRVTRCVYFTVEMDLPTPGWELRLAASGVHFPFFMLGISGVICSPGSDPRFRSPAQVDDLFDAIEDAPGLVVALSDILLPTGLLEVDGRAPARGDVYRVGQSLMQLAFLFRSEQIDRAQLDRGVARLGHEVAPSPEETRVFAEWSAQHIQRARESYQQLEAARRQLEWVEEGARR
jgi:hypothetical protein